MSADNSVGNASVPLRNLLNSIQCIRDRVRDGESNNSDGTFNLSNFWDTLNQAVKTVSQEATKLSLAFSRPPLPSQEDGEKLAESTMKSVLSLSTLFYWLPKSQGVTLRRHIKDATVEVLEGVAQLLEVILSSPLQSLSQEHLTSTGSVWSTCDHFAQLPRDNKAAVLVVLSSQIGVVKDATDEIEQVEKGSFKCMDFMIVDEFCPNLHPWIRVEVGKGKLWVVEQENEIDLLGPQIPKALSEAYDPFSNMLIDHNDEEEPPGNQDTYWSEKDRRVIGPCQGLMKASAACLRNLISAIKANGDVTTPQNVAQLDMLAEISMDISPGVDDLALCLYPPMDYSGVENNVSKVAALLKKVLEMIRSTHVCGEAELRWVLFLDGAICHNLHKAKDLIQQDS